MMAQIGSSHDSLPSLLPLQSLVAVPQSGPGMVSAGRPLHTVEIALSATADSRRHSHPESEAGSAWQVSCAPSPACGAPAHSLLSGYQSLGILRAPYFHSSFLARVHFPCFSEVTYCPAPREAFSALELLFACLPLDSCLNQLRSESVV